MALDKHNAEDSFVSLARGHSIIFKDYCECFSENHQIDTSSVYHSISTRLSSLWLNVSFIYFVLFFNFFIRAVLNLNQESVCCREHVAGFCFLFKLILNIITDVFLLL